MSERWIVIPRWNEFQHPDVARSTVPPWIKNYTRLLHDDAYMSLTEHRALVLHRLWLEYASTRRQLRLDTRSMSRRLGLRVTTADLESLNHAGFIAFSASKPASNVASLEGERDRERGSKEESRAKPVRAGRTGENVPTPTGQAAIPIIERMIRNGVITHPADLDAELSGAKLNSTDADRLRDLLGA